MRRLLGWVIVLGLLGWAGYTAAMVGIAHFSVQDIVDGVLHESRNRRRVAFAAGTQQAMSQISAELRGATVLEARRAGFALEEDNVSVALTSAGIQVTVKWAHPALTWGGERVLVIPLTVQRVLGVTP